MSNLREEALKIHKEHQGKVGIYSKVTVHNAKDLSLAAKRAIYLVTNPKQVLDYLI